MRPPVEPMRAVPVGDLPDGLVYEPKWDGFRAIAWVFDGRVLLQSRQQRNLSAYFPDVTRLLRGLPSGTVLDGELVIWDGGRGRTSFTALQGRITAGRRLLAEARDRPAHFIAFDLLQDAAGEHVGLPLIERRHRLEALLAGGPPQLQLCPQTSSMAEARAWMADWQAAGVEGVVGKNPLGRYECGRPGWSKLKTRSTAEAIVGGVTGSLTSPGALLLGRFDGRGRLRYLGLTAHVGDAGADLGFALERHVAQRYGGPTPHPWPQPLPAAWAGLATDRRPVLYVAVRPTMVVEVEVDVAADGPFGRWRHRARFVRARPDLSVYDVRRTGL